MADIASVTEEQRSVARFLADVVDRERGEEQANVMTVLMDVVQELGDDVEPIAPRIADSLRGYLDEQPLRDEHLNGALEVAVRAEPSLPAPLLDRLFAMPELLDDQDRVIQAGLLLDRLPGLYADRVQEAIARVLPDDADAVLVPLNELPRDAAEDLLEQPIKRALTQRLQTLADNGQEEAAGELGEALTQSVLERDDGPPGELGSEVLWLLLFVRRPPSYAVAERHAGALVEGVPPSQARNSQALQALRQAPPEDWASWSKGVSDEAPSFENQGAWAGGALANILNRFREAETSVQSQVPEIVSRLRRFIDNEASVDVLSEVGEAAETVLPGEDWRADSESRDRQERLHAAIRELIPAKEPLGQRVSEALFADLQRACVITPGAPMGTEVVAGLLSMGPQLPEPQLRRLAQEAVTLSSTGDVIGQVAALRVRLELALAVGVTDGGEEDGALSFPDEELAVAIEAGTRSGSEAVARWFELRPRVDRALTVLRRLDGRSPSSLRRAVSGWAEGLTQEDRTQIVIDLVGEEFDASAWVEAIARNGLDDEEVVAEIATGIDRASQGDRRAELVRSLVAAQPSTSRSQRAVADLMIALLETGKKNDFGIALEAARALGHNHRSAERLRKALKAVTEEQDLKIPKKAVEALAEAGVRPPKKSLTQDARDRLKSIFR